MEIIGISIIGSGRQTGKEAASSSDYRALTSSAPILSAQASGTGLSLMAEKNLRRTRMAIPMPHAGVNDHKHEPRMFGVQQGML
jgi:hypothetical protein